MVHNNNRKHTQLCSILPLLLQIITLSYSTAHLRHHHDHELHEHEHVHDHSHHHHHHHHHNHRRTNEVQSDINPDGGGEGYADVFDSCVLACYSDVVDRYGYEFADMLKADGFHFEHCIEEEEGTIDPLLEEEEGGGNNSTIRRRREKEDSPQQRALTRILGATSELHRTWYIPTSGPPYRNPTTKLLQIPYDIQSDWGTSVPHFTPETLATISAALQHIEEQTKVIKFIPRSEWSTVYDVANYGGGEPTEYIYFNYVNGYGCAANIGKQYFQKTNVYLGWCKEPRHIGNIVHEILHALGFWHEHSRPDRDDHVTINWPYIQSGTDTNFAKASMVNSLGSPYDFNSLMHYPPTAFTTDSSVDTIVPNRALEAWESMGQRAKLSHADIEQLQLLYQCASGPRDGGVTMTDLCSEDCPCWEYAMGVCNSDDECMDDLVCAEYYHTTGIPPEEYLDGLPYYPYTSGQFSCNDYCHENCCLYSANSIMRCPETCNSAPPVMPLTDVPERMCVKTENVIYNPPSPSTGATVTTTVASSTSTTTSSSTTPATTTITSTSTTPAATTTTTTTTAATPETTTTTSTTTGASTTTDTTPTSGVWYADYDIGKCVKYCVGDPPCGGLKDHDQLYTSVEDCCQLSTLNYKAFSDCSYDPAHQTGGTPPTSAPPTHSPSSKPTTGNPTPSPVTPSPTPGVPADAVWYVDWSTSKCTLDCETGVKPCGTRRKDPWELGYSTVQICCVSHLSYVPFEECTNEPEIEARTSTGTGSTAATTTTTTTTTPLDVRWYPAGTTCMNDGQAPNWMAHKYNAQGTCCMGHFSWAYDACMGIVGSTAATTASTGTGSTAATTTTTTTTTTTPLDVRWYPADTTCKNDGQAPNWMSYKYNAQGTCCSGHFSWAYDACMGIAPVGSGKYYIDWGKGKCVKDCNIGDEDECGGIRTEGYIAKHASVQVCCASHMSYDISSCMN